jgi:hypothetical protein
MKRTYTVLTRIPHPSSQYRSQSQLYIPPIDTPLCQALYVFNTENTILQYTKRRGMFTLPPPPPKKKW